MVICDYKVMISMLVYYMNPYKRCIHLENFLLKFFFDRIHLAMKEVWLIHDGYHLCVKCIDIVGILIMPCPWFTSCISMCRL